MGDVLQPGKKEAEKAAEEQKKQIALQKQKEESRKAEEESEIARRQAVSKKGGRSLLVQTSPTGTSGATSTNTGTKKTLGG